MSLIKTVQSRVEKNSMLNRDNAVLVGLSGGPDSVALLLLLNQLKKKYKLDLAAVYINHNIRPKAAKKEEIFCQALCDKLDLEFYLVREDIPKLSKQFKTSLEETARDFRYGVFEELCSGFGYDKIALGHHYDDQVETILFRIMRGSGLSGLSGIPPVRGNIIRPLFDLKKTELVAFLEKSNQPFCTDASNRDIKFKRNYIRNSLLPEIRKNLNPAVDSALINLGEISALENEYLLKIAQKGFKKAIIKSRYKLLELDYDFLIKQEGWLIRRIFREAMQALGQLAPDKIVVERFESFLYSAKKSINLPGNYRLVKDERVLSFLPGKAIKFEQKLALDRRIVINELRCKLRMTKKTKDRVEFEKKRNSDKIMIDLAKLELPLVVRNIRSGDRFSPLGMDGTKKVGDFLTDRKIAPGYRDRIPVLCDRQGIVWVVGMEIDERVKIDKTTKEVAEIEFYR